MKKIVPTLLITIILFSLFVPMVSAVDIGRLDYTVSTTKVNMDTKGTGSFVITVPAGSTPYAGVQFKVQLPDDVTIAKVSYSLASVLAIPPQVSPNDPANDIYYFSCSNDKAENIFTSELKCTVDILYNGVLEKDITILQIKKSQIDGHNTLDYVSDKTAKVTLVPFSAEQPIVVPNEKGRGNSDESTPLAEEINEQEPPTAAAFPFIDVNEGDWFYGDVYYSWLNGLVKGTSDTEFSPNGDITRGMVVTILYRLEGEPTIEGLDNPFSDVAEDVWYTNAIKWAADKGIVLGYTDGTYKPNKSISRQEMAAILYRYSDYAEIELPKEREYQVFDDNADIGGYAQDAVTSLYRAKIINGKPENKFDPNGTATRAEFVAMIHRLIATTET